MNPQKPQKFSEITPEMIQDWKAKHGKYAISELAVPIDRDEKSKPVAFAKFIIAKPNRNVMMAVAEHNDGSTGGGLKSTNVMVENCVLGGDMHAMDDDFTVFAAVVDYLKDLATPYADAVAKKL